MHVDYLKVTMLSDITDDTNKSICTWALTGSEQSNTTITYPHQINPPENCWKKWNTSLTKLFINNEQSSRIYKPLLNPIIEVSVNPLSHMPWELHPHTKSITEYIEALPPFYRTIIGDIQLPLDDGYHLAQVLKSGQTIYSYSDGSVKNKIAAHSYIIICSQDIRKHCISGAGETTGDPNTICSLRPEHTGAIAAKLITSIIECKYQLQSSKGYLNMGIDNITVVGRLTKDKIDDLDDDSHDPTDYDLWQESMSLMEKMSTVVTTMHVKAHQDKKLREDFGGVGPMNRHAHYNIMVDKMAEIKRETLSECKDTFPAPSIKAAISIKGNYITSGTIKHIEHEVSGKPLINYLMRRNKWTKEIFSSIDWDAHESYLTKLPYLKAVKVIKYIHDWQNTGAQKKLFDSKRDEPEHQPHEYQCPMKCGSRETAQHFLRCEKVNTTAEMKRVLDSLRKWFV